jgi:hypothetical protein
MKLSMIVQPELDIPDGDDAEESPLKPAEEVMEESMIEATRHLASVINKLSDPGKRARWYVEFTEKIDELEEKIR